MSPSAGFKNPWRGSVSGNSELSDVSGRGDGEEISVDLSGVQEEGFGREVIIQVIQNLWSPRYSCEVEEEKYGNYSDTIHLSEEKIN